MNKSFFINSLVLIYSLFIIVCSGLYINGFFLLDNNGLYLSFITLIYLMVFCVELQGQDKTISFLLLLSGVCSLICFLTNNILVFWLSYELTIFPLLFLILFWSPYSERFIASWYLMGYILFTSLPMLLIFIIYYFNNLNLSALVYTYNNINILLVIILSFIFFTKVPYPPFHSWLPIVHAEASNLVSMALSGYVMKLGLIGIFRFCLLNNLYFLEFYLFICFFFSLYFLCSAIKELDYKRWLAYLSLSHIQIAGVGLLVSYFLNYEQVFLYSLGHGLSAILLFFFLGQLADLTGSRNWLILLNANQNGIIFLTFFSLGLLTAASFPPTLQFFIEVNILSQSQFYYFLIFCFIFYIFLAGLVPMLILASSIVNAQLKVNMSFVSQYNFIILSILILFSFCLFIFII
uniref:NADH-ubiquinone oxidoreductase chain 4 n=1 Tax=Lepidotrema longipenis TaxID=330067 RepID=A0A346Q021_9PLAT|nr:NADH dehydrogenase subunit 4 [Lepidotrema longipenis]AXR86347.1 NADH dehydrogenase subunit 4 [Lepidotrema longipenis]